MTGAAPAAAAAAAAASVPSLGGKIKLSFIDKDGLRQPLLDLRLDTAEFGGFVWRDVSLRHLFAIDYVFALLLICTFAVLFSMLFENRVRLADLFYSFMTRFHHRSQFALQQVYYHNHFARALVRLDAAVAQRQITYARELYTSLALAYEDLESSLAAHDRKEIYAHLQGIYAHLINDFSVTPKK